jgi:hypothetical protein
MPDEHSFTSRDIDQARPDFAAIGDELDFIRLSLRVSRRGRIWRAGRLGIIFATAGLVIGWIELFWRHCTLACERSPGGSDRRAAFAAHSADLLNPPPTVARLPATARRGDR